VIAVGTSPIIPVLFVVTTIAGLVAMRFGAGSTAAGDHNVQI